MNKLRWAEAANHYESLAVAWRAVLASLGIERTYEECVASLGLGTLTVAADNSTVAEWSTLARDARLIEAADAEGIELRPLHPPAAAAGLTHAREFATHFRDSYLPLIQSALRNNQRVLVWRGWPAPRGDLWGVLTHEQNNMLFGHSLWHNGEPLPLLGAAHQVYVVVTRREAATGAAATYARAVDAAQSAWHNIWCTDPDVITGPSAWNAWRRAAEDPAASAATGTHRHHSQLARTLGAARRCHALWLRQIAGALDDSIVATAAHWANACDHICELLTAFEDAEVMAALLSEPDGTRRFINTLSEIEAIERDTITQLAAP